ncbi:Fatty acid-binding protein homolog 5 [Eumeta japonica]|uniref:Fatty acid-binding protein homolog 5 n=1 Tax=Eumeta variegata TaxID=151549 RepID=A0A4C1YLE8_EUMVA|nr:Fatty acid-binding protein homolog 5 [Eumeta japonica]
MGMIHFCEDKKVYNSHPVLCIGHIVCLVLDSFGTMEQYVGRKYKQVKEENFEEYLKVMGVGLIPRKAAAAASPTVCLTKNDDGGYVLTTSAPIRTMVVNFHVGQEFDETTPDGVKVFFKLTSYRIADHI